MMRAIPALALSTALMGCHPDLGDPASLVTEPRILAVRGDPPEASPGEEVAYRALVVTPMGTVAPPSLRWAFCASPKPLTENNAVSMACLGDGVRPLGGPAAVISAAMPDDACALFGPDTPPGDFRPRDPDETGGFYQPLRVQGEGVTAFALERITCDLPNAPVMLAIELAKRYHPNKNPLIAELDALTEGGDPVPFDHVPAGSVVRFNASWGAGEAETYPALDVETQTLVDRREALRLSWFVTAGALESDVTGRDEADMETTTSNRWTAPTAPGVTHLWLVLRDSRGGVDFLGVDLTVVAP